MSVKFLKGYHKYNEGEVATFSVEHEKWLVSKRIAEPIVLPTKEDDVAKGQTPPDPKATKSPEGPQHRQTTVTSKK
jgi:hypothetical protein